MKAWPRLVIAVLIWFGVLAFASMLAMLPVDLGILEDAPGLASALRTQIGMLGVSLVVIAALTRGRFSFYGFRAPTRRDLAYSLIYGIGAALLVQIPSTIIAELASWENGHPALRGASFLEVVIVIWVVASICEEILHRGLIQTVLEPLARYGVPVARVRLSASVIVCALLFAVMHLPLLMLGAEGGFVLSIVVSAIVLGLVAGVLRERSGSLVPAVIVHMLFNVVGSLLAHLGSL
jgi:membrane protease YdiL (CAAX protease family)